MGPRRFCGGTTSGLADSTAQRGGFSGRELRITNSSSAASSVSSFLEFLLACNPVNLPNPEVVRVLQFTPEHPDPSCLTHRTCILNLESYAARTPIHQPRSTYTLDPYSNTLENTVIYYDMLCYVEKGQ